MWPFTSRASAFAWSSRADVVVGLDEALEVVERELRVDRDERVVEPDDGVDPLAAREAVLERRTGPRGGCRPGGSRAAARRRRRAPSAGAGAARSAGSPSRARSSARSPRPTLPRRSWIRVDVSVMPARRRSTLTSISPSRRSTFVSSSPKRRSIVSVMPARRRSISALRPVELLGALVAQAREARPRSTRTSQTAPAAAAATSDEDENGPDHGPTNSRGGVGRIARFR